MSLRSLWRKARRVKRDRVTLSRAVLAVTNRCPLITRAAVKAEHGPLEARHKHLDEAISNAEELLRELKNVRLVLNLGKSNGDAA
ncbi:hypothetical protein HNQ36_001107 [Afipia massiliensis]|uniref:Uncharacterized protein n=1 Tax=Afipia massiliensis TaxID=211460 RepID=A0A840MT82_9BRAD|nr:hypothetical protein [Afipia massiliensis]MBB5051153.1 hypothetical protein [Afipia massiliensis]